VVDKLGIKAGHALRFDEAAWALDDSLRARCLARIGRELAQDGELVDVVLVAADASTDTVAALERWKGRLQPNGGIWLLTPKRGHQGYVDQTTLIPSGMRAGLVDNKICSVSESISAMRFVLRIRDRATRG
jgi:hypothetical protein